MIWKGGCYGLTHRKKESLSKTTQRLNQIKDVHLDPRKGKKPLKDFNRRVTPLICICVKRWMGGSFTEIKDSGRRPGLREKLMNSAWVTFSQKQSVKSQSYLSRSKTSSPGPQKNVELHQEIHKCLIQIPFKKYMAATRIKWQTEHMPLYFFSKLNYSEDKFKCGNREFPLWHSGLRTWLRSLWRCKIPGLPGAVG